MTNLKKTLAVVLAFAMILSMGAMSTFAAYSDVESGTIVSEAVGILSNLNILTGFEDGTFRPDETVTRAQMAAIICRMLGYEEQAQSSMGTTVFNDVAADHWASGYVNVTQAQGIINGYGDGNFGPEDKVTYEQAVKMIVSALGYDLAAAAKGGYPTGYLAIASAEGITKQANGKVGDAAARSAIAVLVYNALEVQLMDQDLWSTDGTDTYSQKDDTILSKYLDVTKWEGIITATPTTLVAGKTYDSTTTPKATIEGYYWTYQNDKLVKIYDEEGKNFVNTINADKVDTNAYLGKSVIAYIGEDELTSKATIFAIVENENKNDSFKISATQLVTSGEKYWATDDNTIGYKNVGSSKIQDLTLDAGAKIYTNFAAKTIAKTTQAIAGEIKNGGAVEFISNDADSDIEVVVITAYDREAVIETVEEVNGEYAFDTYKGKLPKIDTEDEDTLVIVYKDGVAATAADLAANDTVSYVEVADGFEILYASSATVTGTVDSYDTENDVVTIAGEDYEVSKASGLSVEKLSGEEGIFFLNVDGQIAYNESAPTAAGKYALVLASYNASSGVDTGDYLQVVLADGTLAEYKISDNAKVVDDENNTVSTDVKAYFEAVLSGTVDSGAEVATVSDLYTAGSKLVAKLTISNEKITKVKELPAGTSAKANASSKYDVDSASIGALNFDDSTVVFSVKQTTGNIDAEDIVIGTISNFFVDGESDYMVVGFDEDDNSSIYGAAVGFGLAKPVAADEAVFVVTSKKTTTVDDEEAYVLTGIRGGEEMTITVYNEDGYGAESPESLVAGDVILIAEPDEDGIVSDIEQLVNFNKSTPASTTIAVTSDVDALDQIYSGYGKVMTGTSNKFSINGAVETDVIDDKDNADPSDDERDSSVEDFAAANTGISYKSTANYTLVDYSENFKNPEVTVEDGSEWLFDTEEYVSYAYVRVVDGKLADVVVYRMSEFVPTVEFDVTIDNIEATVGDTIEVECDSDLSYVSYTIEVNGEEIEGTTFTVDEAGEYVVVVTASKSGYEDAVAEITVTASAPVEE